MPKINPLNDELKSNIVKIKPAIAKDAVLKTINGLINYLKDYGLTYKSQIVKPSNGDSYIDFYKNNSVIKNNYNNMSTIEEKIDNLKYLVPPVTVQDVRLEINKLVDIFKTDDKIISSDDFNDLVKELLKEVDDYRIDYGVASSIYLKEDIIEYGNAFTINSEQIP